MPKTYALLVGIDHYFQNDGIRQFTNGKEVSLSPLEGCVSDVNNIKQLLRGQYQVSEDDIRVLSSPNPKSPRVESATDSSDLPTFNNIQREFDYIHEKAAAGDFFFFHFSGHGAVLSRIAQSPLKHLDDPSLLTVDFCQGFPAVRGWVLNEWLKKLNDKGLHVAVSLDSCHSGGAWRGADQVIRYRTPNEWGSVINLPQDEVNVPPRPDDSSGYRAAELQRSWSMNPSDFTLMTACGRDEKAGERCREGRMGGDFTYNLLLCLKRSNYRANYRMILDDLRDSLKPQTPEVHGRDRLLFLGNTEPFLVTPIRARLEERLIHIPAGSAHGVHQGSEFVSIPSSPNDCGFITVDSVDKFTSTARVPAGLAAYREGGIIILPSKWYLAQVSGLTIVVDQMFDTNTSALLQSSLSSRIASPVHVIQSKENVEAVTATLESMVFNLCGSPDNTRIFGPESVTGYNGPVRPMTVGSVESFASLKDYVAAVTIPLVHLAVFGNTLKLRSESCLSFEASVLPQETAQKDSYPEQQAFRYRFRNTDTKDLFFVILNLTPEFSVKQMWPSADIRQKVGANQSYELPGKFRFQRPETSKPMFDQLHATSRREIIRTIVTSDDSVSWKLMEMPTIWNAAHVSKAGVSGKRECIFDSVETEWSIHDIVVRTHT